MLALQSLTQAVYGLRQKQMPFNKLCNSFLVFTFPGLVDAILRLDNPLLLPLMKGEKSRLALGLRQSKKRNRKKEKVKKMATMERRSGGSVGFLLIAFAAIVSLAIFAMASNMRSESQDYQPPVQAAVSQPVQSVSLPTESEDHVPAGFVYGMALIVPSADGGSAVYVPTSPEHNSAHNVVESNPAWATAQTAVAITGGEPPEYDPNNVKCFVMRISGQVARYMVWEFTHTNGVSGFLRGNLAWWHAADDLGSPKWGGAYSNKSLESMMNVPKDVGEQYPDSQVEQIGCDQLPPAPPLAGA